MTAPDREAILRHYARDAAAYNAGWAPVLDAFAASVLDALKIGPGERVLDVGCGTALMAARIARAGARVAGVDLSLEMLRRAGDREPLGGLARADAAALPVRDACVDVVLSAFVLQHFEDRIRAVREAHRVLVRGGRSGFAAWGRSDVDSPAYLAWSALLDQHGAPDDPDLPPSRERRVDTPRKLGRLLERAGFGEVRAWSAHIAHMGARRPFLRRALRGGVLARRLGTLPPERRAAFLTDAAALVQRLHPAAFEWQGEIVGAVGRKA